MRRHTVTIQAPYDHRTHPRRGTGHLVHVRGTITITTRELEGDELGTLNTPSGIPALIAAAATRMNAANVTAYQRNTAQLRTEATSQGYYRSPPHQIWAGAAQLRTGSRIPRDWWIENDPFGGTAGNGPNILPEGKYPGWVSKIAMGHDTDWTLGRQFNAGPLKGLYTSKESPADMGIYGLSPTSPVTPGLYLNLYTSPGGHPDWQVVYGELR